MGLEHTLILLYAGVTLSCVAVIYDLYKLEQVIFST